MGWREMSTGGETRSRSSKWQLTEIHNAFIIFFFLSILMKVHTPALLHLGTLRSPLHLGQGSQLRFLRATRSNDFPKLNLCSVLVL